MYLYIFSKSRELKDIRYDAYNDKDKDKCVEKTQYMLCFWKAGGIRISNMISLPLILSSPSPHLSNLLPSPLSPVSPPLQSPSFTIKAAAATFLEIIFHLLQKVLKLTWICSTQISYFSVVFSIFFHHLLYIAQIYLHCKNGLLAVVTPLNPY